MAELARTDNPARLRRAARRLVESVQADTIAARHQKARAERRVELQPAHDGMAWLHLLLPAADALLIKNRLCQAADRARRAEPSAPSTGAGVIGQTTREPLARHDEVRRELAAERHLDQLRADLARDLLLHAIPPGPPRDAPERRRRERDETRHHSSAHHSAAEESAEHHVSETVSAEQTVASLTGIRPTVHVTVPVMTLLGRTDEPGLLDGYGPIDADTARALAGEAASFTRLLTHPVTSAVLDVDRTSYRVPADLRRWLQVRDGTCRFPGCSRAAIRCDLDHSEGWAGEGGATSHDNLAHLCAAHHHLKHDTGWSLRHLHEGVLEWTSLTGARYRTAPESGLTMVSPPRAPDSAAPTGRPPF
ncbi:HNH endonuclease signature motif containing protein [Agromyces aerolatus]|uniref:HNH endonuclease signature motif containing protein n=1 Tax=Agromyces sp. LY-1074 TaxID=3074080 RepID=UPI0028621E0D|nr:MULTISPECIES: HNH endonuclease signature motif containing protein [unclassified Agromyces]MDR5699666.1 HNH endonuclease signature motif containing protein [Agromyces sp. LY-1074]MDR5705962.1 HNH endonuclease signature motif containing protein [Agromyces sp. LY-1358]